MARAGCLVLALTPVAAAAMAVTLGPAASAHSDLSRLEPPAGSTLAAGRAPVLHFALPIVLAGSKLEAVGPGGAVTPLAPIAHAGSDERTMTVSPSVVPNLGAVTIRWAILARDGHRSEGGYPLTLPPTPTPVATKPVATLPPAIVPVATVPAPAPAVTVPAPVVPVADAPVPADEPALGADPSTRAVERVFIATRTAGYVAMTVLCGGLAFLVLVWADGAGVGAVRRLLWGAWAAGVASSVVGAGLHAAYTSRLGLGSAFDPSVVVPTFDTRAGLAWGARGLLFVLAVPVLTALSRRGRAAVGSLGWRVGAAAVGIGLLRTPGLVGHSSEGRFAVLGTIADFAHLAGVAVWFGGLVFLCAVVIPRRRPDELHAVVPRFSTIAGAAVATVVIAGTFLSWQLVGSVPGLTGSRFGNVLLFKLALVAAIGGAAWQSHRWATARLDLALTAASPSAPAALRPFVFSVATEVALAVAVLAVASQLVATSPAR